MCYDVDVEMTIDCMLVVTRLQERHEKPIPADVQSAGLYLKQTTPAFPAKHNQREMHLNHSTKLSRKEGRGNRVYRNETQHLTNK